MLHPFRWVKPLGVLFVSFLFFASCSPSSSTDFHQEGEALCRLLISELQMIHTREDVMKAEEHLKKIFNSLVDLMIEARQFYQKFPEEALSEPTLDEEAWNQELHRELARVYAIEGGREGIEKAEREALIRLDGFKKMLAKQNQSRGSGKTRFGG